jgi:hypothetical protein
VSTYAYLEVDYTTAATTPATTHCCLNHRLVEAAVESHLLAGIVGLATSFKGHEFGYCSRSGGFGKGASARECGV